MNFISIDCPVIKMDQFKKRLVVSAVNLNEGGPLTVLNESLDSAAQILGPEWEITALVHRKSLISNPRVSTVEFPQSKRSWLIRLFLEWVYFLKLSRSLNADLWLSLHDITPRVHARRQVVYCHNPSPFYQLTWREVRLEPKLKLFNLLYAQLYRIFILRNYAVVVQQDWLRDTFRSLFGHQYVIVAHPSQPNEFISQIDRPDRRVPTIYRPLVLLYPALPRVFKNMDVLCEAMALLPPSLKGLVELRLTLSGIENPYARDLLQRFSSVPGVKFIGLQGRTEMDEQYEHCDIVLFPSKLETWGLPITEAKSRNKPLLVADARYAYETVGTYDAVSFLPAEDAAAWAKAIADFATGDLHFTGQKVQLPYAPFAANWPQLWQLLTDGL